MSNEVQDPDTDPNIPDKQGHRRRSARRNHVLANGAVAVVFTVILFGGPWIAVITQLESTISRLPQLDPNNASETQSDAAPQQSRDHQEMRVPPATTLEVEESLFRLHGEALLAKATTALAKYHEVSSRYRNLKALTLTDEVGRRIATDSKLLSRFVALNEISDIETAIPTKFEIARLRVQLMASQDSELQLKIQSIVSEIHDATLFEHSRENELIAIRTDTLGIFSANQSLAESLKSRNCYRKMASSMDAVIAASNAERKRLRAKLKRIKDEATAATSDLARLQES